MFDRLSIRTKLIAIVAAPLAVIIGLAGLGYTQRSDEATGTRADAARLQAIVAAQALQHEIQLEALYSVAFLAGPDDASPEALEAQRTRVDEASSSLQRAMGEVDPADPAQDAAVSARRAVDQVANSLRGQISERSLDWTWVENLYRNALASLPPLNGRLVDAISDGALADGASTVVALGEYTTSQARIGVILAGAAAADGFPDVMAAAAAAEDDPAAAPADSGVSTRSVFTDAVDRAEVELAVVSSQAGSRVRASLRNRMVGGDLSYFSETVARVRALAPTDPVAIDPTRWTNAVEETLEQLRSIANAEADTVLATAADRVDSADRAARLFLIGAAVAVFAALALAVSVATSIARPVMSLTAAADRVANEQLPKLVDALRDPSEAEGELMRPDMEEIDVKGGKELAKLSASVSQIQEVAVSVATEQATMLRKGIGDMFINLARRNQGLLDRQLEFIDELEAQEDDPDQLEHLFKLDHMATRMRRNAESLLVLAGAEPGRRRGKPVPLTKVALAAVGEIEHFARIDLLDVDESEVVSSAAADLAHLLSELMENATQFSPPDSRVEVVGHGNNGGGYTISITDQGIGMSAEQLADANALLTRPPLLGLTLARTLGFIVVGRLATRHGITVRLVPSPAGGVTAIVSIPSSVLVAQLDTLDLSEPASDGFSPSPGGPPSASSAGPVKETVATPSSILPPFEFYSGPMDGEPTYDDPAPYEEPAPYEPIGYGSTDEPTYDTPAYDSPATLEEAVPTGDAFDEGLSTVAEAPEPLIGATPPAPSAVAAPASASPLFGPPPAAGPRPLTPPSADDRPTVDGEAPVPAGPRLFGTGGSPAGRPPSAPPAPPATGGTHLFRPPTPTEAFVPPVPPPSSPTPLPTRTPGPPPGDLLSPASLPTRGPSSAPPAPPRPPAAPVPPAPPLPTRSERTGPSASPGPGDPPPRSVPSAPSGLPGEPPVAPAGAGMLPGEPPVSPAADLPGEPPVAPPLPTRTAAPTPAVPAARAPEPLLGDPVSTNGSAPSAPASNGASSNGNGHAPDPSNGSGPTPATVAPEVTSSGLVKRVPRRAGADRAVPGSDGPRRGPTTTSTRSPDEVRAMLSRFHSGKQAGRSPSGAPSFDSTPAPSNTEEP